MGAREGRREREREEERILQCAINSLDNDLLTKQSCGINSVLDLFPTANADVTELSFHWLAYVSVCFHSVLYNKCKFYIE